MNARLIGRCLRRNLREALPQQHIKVIMQPNCSFNIQVKASRAPMSKIKRIVERFFRCAYGVKVEWGKQ